MNRKLKTALTVTFVAVVGIAAIIGAAAVQADAIDRAMDSVLPDVLLPCATEDSDNCWWDGGENGEGLSFVVIDGEITYLLPQGR